LTHNNGWYQLIDNEEPIVWNKPILDIYWDQLEAVIDQKKLLGIVTKIDGIHVENLEIKKERLDWLLSCLVEEPLIQASASISTMLIFVERASSICQNWWMLVPCCKPFLSIIIGLITWIQSAAYPDH
jgi:hypothetical protein